MSTLPTLSEQRETQLLDLPDEMLSAVLRQLVDAKSRLHVFKASRRLATAMLQNAPSICLTYPTTANYDDGEEHDKPIAPFLAQAVEAREAPVKLTLKPDEDLFPSYFKKRAKAEAVARLASSTLGAVGLCTAVQHLGLCFSSYFGTFWKPAYSARLCASFPSLTSLTLQELKITSTQLGLLVSHPLLLPKLRHLDISSACIRDNSDDAETATSPFQASKLQHLTLSWGDWDFIPHLAPLASHLTQLEILEVEGAGHFVSSTLAEAISALTCLEWLCLATDKSDEPISTLLPVLAQMPSLHTLILEGRDVEGDVQLDALLAATQITHLQVHSFSGLTLSKATAACSWRRLEIDGEVMDWVTAASLPLHNLNHPLYLRRLGQSGVVGVEVLAAAELNLCERNKAGLVVQLMVMDKALVGLLTEQYLSHRHAAQKPPHPTEPSSNHSGPSTSLASSISPKGHVTQGGPGSSSGQGGQPGAAAGRLPLMQRLGQCVNSVCIVTRGEARYHDPYISRVHLSLAPSSLQALAALFPKAHLHICQAR
ncbi:hypothetical protein QJQ45_010641 [Haematococcus lacustris]|nr:hypothetical protein QJQ45_010641 [Haematococcus lacustris]